MRYDIKRIEEDIKKRLSPFRYHHTMLVAKEAVCLANYYQIEEQKAVVASLLHDIAKEYTKKESDDFIDKYQLPQGLKKEEFQNIVHADIGAELAREYYDIENDIYLAIQYHTIGNKDMSLLAKIIFIADKIGRKNLSPKMKKVESLAYKNIDEAMQLLILIEKEKLEEKGLKLHSNTFELLSKLEKELVNKNRKMTVNQGCNILEQVLNTSYYVARHSKHVRINKDMLKAFVLENEFAKTAHWLSSNPFSLLDLNVADIVKFLIIYDAMDCSFWGNPKWTIDAEKEKLDGAFALMYALLKLRNKKGHLNFEEISFNEFKEALKGNVEIPLLKERYEVVLEVSKIINSKMNGNFYQYVKDITDDLSLFYTIIENFPSFEDKREYEGKVVYFYKLAQLATSDILHIRKLKENIDIDCSHLVGCADYKIPQVLRGIGVLEYDEELSNLVDNKCEIAENSIYEVEIRANMIVSVDLIKKKLNEKIDAIEINDIIWSLGQDKQRKFLPYHLTRTLSY